MIKVFNVLEHDTLRDYVVNDYAEQRHFMVTLDDSGVPQNTGYALPPPANAVLVAQFSTLYDYLATIKATLDVRCAIYSELWPRLVVMMHNRLRGDFTTDMRPSIDARHGLRAHALRKNTSVLVSNIQCSFYSDYSEHKEAADEMIEYLKAAQGRVSQTLIQSCADAFNEAMGVNYSEYIVIRAQHCRHWTVYEDKHEHEDGSYEVCDSCYSNDYVTCEETGESMHQESLYYWDSDDGYHNEPEPDSDNEEESDDLLSYGSRAFMYLTQDKPTAQEIASSWKIPLGIELEVEHDSRYAAVPDTLDKLGRDYAVCKEDGSLNDKTGFEIVTAARLLPEHVKRFGQWKPMRGMTAWDAGHCGMHVHIDSQAFTTASLSRMIAFFDRDENKTLVTKIAGRHPDTSSQARSYARKTTDTGNVAQVFARKKSEDGERYRMVNTLSLSRSEANRLSVSNGGSYNTRGFSTVEVRIFRASLNKARLLAQIEFTHALVTFSRCTYNSAIGHADFINWLLGNPNNRTMYQHLLRFLGHDRAVPKRSVAEPVAA